MQKEYENKGVVIVALTDEPSSKVSPFVKKNNINYIVGTDARNTLTEYGIRGFPTVYVIDPEGTVAYVGHDPKAAEETVEELRDKKPPKKTTSLASSAGKPVMAKADKLYKAGKYGQALREYQKLAKTHGDTGLGKKAKAKADKMKADEKIMAQIREADAKKKCTSWLDTARLLAKQEKNNEAIKYYQRVIDEYPDTEFAITAKTEMMRLKG